MIEIPKIPPADEMRYRQQSFFQGLYEQVQSSSRVWYYVLLFVVVAAVPAALILKQLWFQALISRYEPPIVNENPLNPEQFQITKIGLLPGAPGSFSVYAQVINPNPTLTAWSVDYVFVLKDSAGRELVRAAGNDFLLPAESKFFIAPKIDPPGTPSRAELEFGRLRWNEQAAPEPAFEVIRQNSGTTEEGNFFVEGEVRNPGVVQFRTVKVKALVFDRSNSELVAVNQTELSDLKPLEARYFRMIWPGAVSSPGQIQVLPSVNPFEPGTRLEEQEKVPAR